MATLLWCYKVSVLGCCLCDSLRGKNIWAWDSDSVLCPVLFQGRNQRGPQQAWEKQVGSALTLSTPGISRVGFQCLKLGSSASRVCQEGTPEGVFWDPEEKHPQRGGEEDLQSERAQKCTEIHPGRVFFPPVSSCAGYVVPQLLDWNSCHSKWIFLGST